MLKTTSYLAAVALVATLPTFATAQSIAVSLSASLDDGDPTSVSVAAALGDFAVASTVATANSTGAASGAYNGDEFSPVASVSYNADANAYETNVAFAAAPDDEDDEFILDF